MICHPCRHQFHVICAQIRSDPDNPVAVGYVEKSWCDCQHRQEGVNRNLGKAENELTPVS